MVEWLLEHEREEEVKLIYARSTHMNSVELVLITICISFSASVSQEGLLWFQNLSVADPYGILPLCFLIPSLMNITVSDSNTSHRLHGSTHPRIVQWHR